MIPESTLRLIPGFDPFATAEDGDWFDHDAAEDVIAFFHEHLVHVKGGKAKRESEGVEIAAKPLTLELWQQAILANLYGWKRADGSRRFTDVFIYVPRKNGKTTIAAGLALYCLFCDPEPGKEIICAAAGRTQAALVFDPAVAMIEANPELANLVEITRSQKTIHKTGTTSSFKAISAEAPDKHGLNLQLVIVDETHAQPNRELVDVLETATAGRDQPITIHITTADFQRESICNEKLEYAKQVRDGIIEDPSFLPVLYYAEPEDDYTDPAVWAKCNPNYKVSVFHRYLEKKCRVAKSSPSFLNTFLRLHLNISTEQDVRWLDVDLWDRCKDETVTEDALAGEVCYAGLDLSSTEDLTAFVLWFPEHNAVLAWFWAPRVKAHEREKKHRAPYLAWERAGHIKLIPGNVIDYDVVHEDILEISERFQIVEIGVDPWNSQHMQTWLEADGFEIIAYGQQFSGMSGPTKELGRLVTAAAPPDPDAPDEEAGNVQPLRHNGDPVLRWNASNVTIKQDHAGNERPDKSKSSEKIDGIVALIMALGRAALAEEPDDGEVELWA